MDETDKFSNLFSEIGRMIQTRFPEYEFSGVEVHDWTGGLHKVQVDLIFEEKQ